MISKISKTYFSTLADLRFLLNSYGFTGRCWFAASYEDQVSHTSILFHRPLPLSKDVSSPGWSSVQSLSHVRLCVPMDCSTPGVPVHHQLLEFAQTQVHLVGDAIQPFHPLSSPSPPAPNPSQHQSLFQWVNSLHEVAKGLELLKDVLFCCWK